MAKGFLSAEDFAAWPTPEAERKAAALAATLKGKPAICDGIRIGTFSGSWDIKVRTGTVSLWIDVDPPEPDQADTPTVVGDGPQT